MHTNQWQYIYSHARALLLLQISSLRILPLVSSQRSHMNLTLCSVSSEWTSGSFLT